MQTSGCACCHSLCDFHKLFKSEPVISIVGGRGGGEGGEEGHVKEKLGICCPFSVNCQFFLWSKLLNVYFAYFSKDELLLWGSKAAMKALTPVSYFLSKNGEKKKSFCLITVFKSHNHTSALVQAVCILGTVTPGSEPARWQPREAQAQGSPKPGSCSQPSPGHHSLLPASPAHGRLPGLLLRHYFFCLDRIASFFSWAYLNRVPSANNQCIQDIFW